jgi:rare lipoprotein A
MFVGGASLVVAVLYIVAQTHVTLVIGGEPRAISTSSQNVRQLLEGQGISLSGGVRVVPPLATELADGMTVVVSPAPGAPIAPGMTSGTPDLGSVTIDFGSAAANPAPTGVGVWVVEGASSGPAARIAAELAGASASVDSAGTSPVVSVRAVVAGKVYDVLTDARTTGELLSAMGITPGAHDRVQPPPSTPLHVGSSVVYDRVRILTHDVIRSIPFATRTTWSDRLAAGQVHVVSAGVTGLEDLTERVVVVNGHVRSRTIVRDRVLRPAIDGARIAGPTSTAVPPAAAGDQAAAGVATWYDPPWSGLTAASPWIPFGTRVAVTDLATGRTVIVVIDDRGPFASGRIIDLSPEAFSVLSPLGRGVLDVRISW